MESLSSWGSWEILSTPKDQRDIALAYVQLFRKLWVPYSQLILWVLNLAALKWLQYSSSVSTPVFSCALKHLCLPGKYSISSQQEAFVQPLTKLLLKGNSMQESGRPGKWAWQRPSSTRMMRGMFWDPFLELLVCLHQLADFQGKLWTVVLLEQVKVEPFATA